jgi:hypothetical protein
MRLLAAGSAPASRAAAERLVCGRGGLGAAAPGADGMLGGYPAFDLGAGTCVCARCGEELCGASVGADGRIAVDALLVLHSCSSVEVASADLRAAGWIGGNGLCALCRGRVEGDAHGCTSRLMREYLADFTQLTGPPPADAAGRPLDATVAAAAYDAGLVSGSAG